MTIRQAEGPGREPALGPRHAMLFKLGLFSTVPLSLHPRGIYGANWGPYTLTAVIQALTDIQEKDVSNDTVLKSQADSDS